MAKRPWMIEPGANATIRFLDEPAPSPYIWVKRHVIPIPEEEVEHLLDVESKHYPTDVPSGRLKIEVKDWCIKTLEGNKAFVRGCRSFNPVTLEPNVWYNVEFDTENDALHFKLRWIGTNSDT